MSALTRDQLRRLHRRLGIPSDYTRRRHLPWQHEARKLVSIGPAADDGKTILLAPRAAAAWKRMQAAAAGDGVSLLPLSGFRSVRRQAKIIRTKLERHETIDQILTLVAAPGCSEHHTGRALDLGSPSNLELDHGFARTREFRWLQSNARKFGFRLSYPKNNRHRIRFEPWHWCWRAS